MSEYKLVKTKTSGNYMLYNKKNKKIRSKLFGVYCPHGVEEYNSNYILNCTLYDTNNYNGNVVLLLNKINKSIEILKDACNNDLDIKNKTYYPFMVQKKSKEGKLINEYNVRGYIKHGLCIRHKTMVGEVEYNQMKGKTCDIEIELGSLWKNDETNYYGITIYITKITIR